jgi:hypothetical protein
MTIFNQNRFPHMFQLYKMKGMDAWDRTEEAEKYYDENQKELDKEYEEIMATEVRRDLNGGNKKMHMIIEDEHT